MWFVAIEPRSVSSTRFGDRVGARLPPPAFAVKKTIRNHDLSRAFVAIQAVGDCHAWNRGSVVAVPFATVRLGIRPPETHLAMRMAWVNSSPHVHIRPPANGVARMPLRTCSGELRIVTSRCDSGPVLNAIVSRSNRPAGRFRDASCTSRCGTTWFRMRSVSLREGRPLGVPVLLRASLIGGPHSRSNAEASVPSRRATRAPGRAIDRRLRGVFREAFPRGFRPWTFQSSALDLIRRRRGRIRPLPRATP